MKTCSKCQLIKSKSEFYKDSSHKDGLQSSCKTCVNSYQKQYNADPVKKDKKATYDKSYSALPEKHLAKVFHHARDRCTILLHPRYSDWGGRGIKMNFPDVKSFVDYCLPLYNAALLKYSGQKVQCDRINNDGSYEPGNIRFVTCKMNCANRR